ncbi:hypothetical protein EON78_00995 [bacterium]|nr:MAG: hypothetical protein EON78_00995 [bacterium]
MATDKLKSEIAKYNKFEIVEDQEFNQLIKGIDIEDNKQNIINFARDRNIQNILFCKFRENDVTFNDLNLTQEFYVANRRIAFQIDLIDTSTGDKRFTFEDNIVQMRRQNGKTFYQILEQEFDRVLGRMAEKIDEKFLLKAKVITQENDKIILNKGFNDGIKEGMIFTYKKQEKNPNSFVVTKDSYLRVVSVSENRSELILISGSNPDKDTELTETKNDPQIEGTVSKLGTSIFENSVEINLGSDKGIKVGQIFKVVEKVSYKDSKTGRNYTIADKERGLIFITDTETKTASARIIRGRSEIKNGMKIVEYDKSYLEPLIKVALYGYQPMLPSLSARSILRLSTGYEDLRYKYYFDYGVNTTITKVQTVTNPPGQKENYRVMIEGINGSIGYKFNIIPEYIDVSPLLQVGFGLNDPTNQTIALDITPKGSIIFSYNRFSLWLEGGYSAKFLIRPESTAPNSSGFIYGGGLSVNF